MKYVFAWVLLGLCGRQPDIIIVFQSIFAVTATLIDSLGLLAFRFTSTIEFAVLCVLFLIRLLLLLPFFGARFLLQGLMN